MYNQEYLNKLLENATFNDEDFDDPFSEEGYLDAHNKVEELLQKGVNRIDICVYMYKHKDEYELTDEQYALCLSGCEHYLPERFKKLLVLNGIYSNIEDI